MVGQRFFFFFNKNRGKELALVGGGGGLFILARAPLPRLGTFMRSSWDPIINMDIGGHWNGLGAFGIRLGPLAEGPVDHSKIRIRIRASKFGNQNAS